jgi:CHRD domain-containing protein
MKTRRFRLAAALGLVVAVAVAVVAIAAATGGHGIREKLTGYQEVPAVSTPGHGSFRASIDRQHSAIHYVLTYGGLESPATQSHIHFENRTNAGPVIVFLCTNLGNGPAGTQPCPANGGTISGTIRPADVLGGGAAQGLAAGEFNELVRAIKAGATYVNVHSVGHPAGEIRAQLVPGHHGQGENQQH